VLVSWAKRTTVHPEPPPHSLEQVPANRPGPWPAVRRPSPLPFSPFVCPWCTPRRSSRLSRFGTERGISRRERAIPGKSSASPNRFVGNATCRPEQRRHESRLWCSVKCGLSCSRVPTQTTAEGILGVPRLDLVAAERRARLYCGSTALGSPKGFVVETRRAAIRRVSS
jgi:hypothetical protein